MRKQLIEYLEAVKGRALQSENVLKWERQRQTRASRTLRCWARTKARKLASAAPASPSCFAGWDHEVLVGAIKSLQAEALCKADLSLQLMRGLPCRRGAGHRRAHEARRPGEFLGLRDVAGPCFFGPSGWKLTEEGVQYMEKGSPEFQVGRGQRLRIRCTDPSPQFSGFQLHQVEGLRPQCRRRCRSGCHCEDRHRTYWYLTSQDSVPAATPLPEASGLA